MSVCMNVVEAIGSKEWPPGRTVLENERVRSVCVWVCERKKNESINTIQWHEWINWNLPICVRKPGIQWVYAVTNWVE